MRLLFVALGLFIPILAIGLEKLPEQYLVAYGDPEAPLKIVEYFSFQCPHCLSLFREDFRKIKASYIDTNQIYWVFHPIPSDLVTIQGMICLGVLSEYQKKLYLETLLDEAEAHNPEFTSLIMAKVMEILQNPLPKLQNETFIQESSGFLDAFTFLTQEEKILAVPTIEVNQTLFPKEVPDFTFVDRIAKRRGVP